MRRRSCRTTFRRPIVDVALVARRTASRRRPPHAEPVGQGPGGVAVALLRREDTWSPIIEETIGVGSATGGSKPWLVELGARRFAVLTVDPDTGRTFVAAVSVAGDPDIGHPLAQATTTIDLVVTDAGAADTDGDGIAELVVTGVVGQPDSPPRCVQTIVEVIDGSSLATRAAYPMTDRRLAGAAIGEWDGRPGADLLAYVAEGDPCTNGSSADPEVLSGLLALRLRDGSTIVDLPRHSSIDPLGPPLAFDLDDDGRDEALVRDGPSLVLLDPSRGWLATAVADEGAVPMLAAPSEGPDANGGRIAWFGPEGTRSGMVVSMTGVFRARTGEIVVTTPASMDLPGLPSTRGELGRLLMQDAATLQQAPQVWRGDLDDGCPEVPPRRDRRVRRADVSPCRRALAGHQAPDDLRRRREPRAAGGPGDGLGSRAWQADRADPGRGGCARGVAPWAIGPLRALGAARGRRDVLRDLPDPLPPGRRWRT